MTLSYNIVHIDYNNESHGNDLVNLLNDYAKDPMGGGQELKPETMETLVSKLANIQGAISLICYHDDNAVALVNAFDGFSSFAAAPLINIHDVYIHPNYRGKGILESMFNTLEDIAKRRGCCKLTLEVLSNNEPAKAAYKKAGFAGYELLEGAGQAVFWQKSLR